MYSVQEGSCVLSGIAYNGKNEHGEPLWNGSANINLKKYFTATCIQHFIESFNLNTNRWVVRWVEYASLVCSKILTANVKPSYSVGSSIIEQLVPPLMCGDYTATLCCRKKPIISAHFCCFHITWRQYACNTHALLTGHLDYTCCYTNISESL